MKSIFCECGNDFWEVTGNIAKCTNCNHTREYHRRDGNSGQITKSQQSKIDFIKSWFMRYFRKTELANFEVKYQNETGYVYVIVDTTDNIFTSDGGMFMLN